MPIDYHFQAGESPLLLSFPHNGTKIPEAIATRMTAQGVKSVDTDWYVRDLYDFADHLSASTLSAEWSRYVVDLNRPVDGRALYPGQLETSLCPIHTFDGQALYRGTPPDKFEIEQRTNRYWRPYHDCLRMELERIKSIHGYAVLWDAHSIRGFVSSLFAGRLPQLNFGSNDQMSADQKLGEALVAHCAKEGSYSAVLNGRFKGGYITRHYGAPEEHIHAIQLEINQQTYLCDENLIPPQIDTHKKARLSALLEQLLRTVLRLSDSL